MNLEALLAKMAGTRVAIVGDVMLDEFIWGEVRRISPEAPVPVVEVQRRTFAPGGAGNVAANVVSLGGVAELGGAVGEDENARHLAQTLAEFGVLSRGLYSDATRPTTTKTRIIAHGHQIARIDTESRAFLGEKVANALLEWSAQTLSAVQSCVLSDYSKGVVSSDFSVAFLKQAQEQGTIVLVDPKGKDYAKYRGATLITPNLHELEVAVGREIHDDASLSAAAAQLRALLPETALLVTRGAQGMSLFRANAPPLHIPTVARHVYDVTGAGDTVVSALALALGAGAEMEVAARLANFAAGIAVGKLGTTRVSREELLQNV